MIAVLSAEILRLAGDDRSDGDDGNNISFAIADFAATNKFVRSAEQSRCRRSLETLRGADSAARGVAGKEEGVNTAYAALVRRALILALSGAVLSCGAAEPMGQFGNYKRTHQYIRLDGDQTLKVFRLKYWVFDYDSPAIQLEYESPTHVADSASLYALAGESGSRSSPMSMRRECAG